MHLIDSHCHIHEAGRRDASGDDSTIQRWQKAGNPDPKDIINRAKEAGVNQLICVGTTLADSRLAVELAGLHPECFASVGIHPHEAKIHTKNDVKELGVLARQAEVVAIGEIGLDYFYGYSPKKDQKNILKQQLELAQTYKLPVIFHIREAFDDFFAILDDFEGIRGVVHSFSTDSAILDKILARGLYIGLNGIMTFTKSADQLEAAKSVPSSRLVLETDSPFLTPAPHRGRICEPKHLLDTAEFLANLRGESLEDLAMQTTQNAKDLFSI